MSSSEEDHTAQSDAVPPGHQFNHAPQDSDDQRQASHDTEDQQEAQAIAPTASQQEASMAQEPPLTAAVLNETFHVEHSSSQEELSEAAEASDDDGDISLVTSPKMDESASSIGTASSSHRRIDSVPPQKYNVTHDATNGLSTAFASASLHEAIEEEEIDISTQSHDDSADIVSASRSSAAPGRLNHHEATQPLPSPTTIDKADLNFVDITLDAPEQNGSASRNTLEPTDPLAGSTRTAEQIRRDSVCSQNATPSMTASTHHVEQDAVLAASARLSRHDSSPPLSPSIGAASGNRSVEGRYRGRRSATTSRAASPARSPSPGPSAPPRTSMAPSQEPVSDPTVENRRSIAPAPVLLAADEHGNISVVSDVSVSPLTAPEETQRSTGQHQGSEPVISATTATTAQAEPRPSQSTSKVATSLSEEVTAAEAAETCHTSPASDPRESTSSSLAPPNGAVTSSSDPGLTDKADQITPKTRRKSSSAGTDPVESRTRMTTLPAKPKTEEIKHRADFERMMMAAKEAERKKRDDEEERKRRRQDEQREALGRWEREILPSWSRARKDAELEQLWWQGAPPSIRGRVWALAIGNPLMLPRNLLEQSEKKAAPVEATIPRRVLEQIDADVADTLPSLKLFQVDGPLNADLVRVCRAFVLVRIEQVAQLDGAGDADRAASQHQHASPVTQDAELPEHGAQDEYARRGIDIYQPGLAGLAAVLLINMSIGGAFIALLNLLHSKPWLKALYSLLPTTLPPASPTARQPGRTNTLPPKDKAIRGFERVLETLLADQMPKVYANLLAHNIEFHLIVRDWVGTLWSRWLDVDTVMRLWDVVLLDETDAMIYRACLAVVQTLESRLYVPDAVELDSVLRGTNRAALAVWRRDKQQRGQLDAASAAHADEPAPRDYVYEQYAIQEDHVFDALEAQKSWWKQSTLQRLLDRELSE